MSDTDARLLEDANATVMKIDLRYRQSDINDKLKLKPARDEAFNAYSAARLKLLEDGIITTSGDLTAMKELRQAVEDAARIQDMVIAAGRVAGFLIKFAV